MKTKKGLSIELTFYTIIIDLHQDKLEVECLQ